MEGRDLNTVLWPRKPSGDCGFCPALRKKPFYALSQKVRVQLSLMERKVQERMRPAVLTVSFHDSLWLERSTGHSPVAGARRRRSAPDTWDLVPKECKVACLWVTLALVPEGSSEVSGEPPKIQRAIPKKERGNGSEDGSPPCLFASEIPQCPGEWKNKVGPSVNTQPWCVPQEKSPFPQLSILRNPGNQGMILVHGLCYYTV